MADRKQTSTPEFRAEAVRLAQTNGLSRREVAADLGVGLSTLRNWIDGRREREMDHPSPTSGRGKAGCLWLWSSICTPAASWIGRRATVFTRNLP